MDIIYCINDIICFKLCIFAKGFISLFTQAGQSLSVKEENDALRTRKGQLTEPFHSSHTPTKYCANEFQSTH